MAVYLEDLLLGKKDANIEFSNGKTMKVTYDPDKITAGLVQQLEVGTETLSEQLAELISDWDLMDANGVKIPIEKETFMTKMRLPIVNIILKGIIDDAFPKVESTSSNGGSRRKA